MTVAIGAQQIHDFIKQIVVESYILCGQSPRDGKGRTSKLDVAGINAVGLGGLECG